MSPSCVALGADSFFLSCLFGVLATDRRSWTAHCALFGAFDALATLAPALGAAALPAYLSCVLLVLCTFRRRVNLLTLVLAAAQGADNYVAHGSVLDACASGVVTAMLAATGLAVGAIAATTARRALRFAANVADTWTAAPPAS